MKYVIYIKNQGKKIVFVCLGGFLCNIGTRLLITACFQGADAALALAGGDLSVLGPTEARALISDACCTPMFYYLY